jgi:hypothetical protein
MNAVVNVLPRGVADAAAGPIQRGISRHHQGGFGYFDKDGNMGKKHISAN